MLTVGPSSTLRPMSRVSCPSRLPYASACATSKDAASAIGAGSAVAEGWVTPLVLTPAGPLVRPSCGMPRRGRAGITRYWVLVWMPCSWAIFSSSVSCATIARARSSGVTAGAVAACAFTVTAATVAAANPTNRTNGYLLTGRSLGCPAHRFIGCLSAHPHRRKPSGPFDSAKRNAEPPDAISVDLGAAVDAQLAARPLVERGVAEPHDAGGVPARRDRQPVAGLREPPHDAVDLDRQPPAGRQHVEHERLVQRQHQRPVERRVRGG